MTVPFPQDSRLPQLQMLLDERVMVRIIAEALEIPILRARPMYVRYKPETSCIVQYELEFQSDDAKAIGQIAYIKVYADGRAEHKANSGRAGRMDNRLENLEPHAPKVNYLPQVDGVLQVFPADLDLPGLARVADRNGAKRMLKKAFGLASSPALDSEPELIRYKPGRKALFRYEAEELSSLPLYGKVFESMDVTEMRDTTESLIAKGVPTAAVLGLVEKQNFIVHETVPGVALNELRARPEYSTWMKPLANELWKLHSVDLPSLPRHDLGAEIQTLRELREQLVRLLPHLEARLDRFLETVELGLIQLDDILVTSHGDFYDDQALVDGDDIALIDLEALRSSHPLIDSGNMLAHLSVGAMRGDDTLSARNVFLQQVRDHSGASEPTIALFEAAAILKLAPGPFRRLEENWPERVELIVALAEARLTEHGAASGFDPALPQLTAIMDVTAMSGPVSRAVGYSEPSLESIDLVRHKPGRRAILRFAFTDGIVVYGKTFASKRGPKVFRITKRISDASAFGPDALTPAALGYLPEHKLVLLGEAPGEPAETQLLSSKIDLAERIAFSLFHLHSSGLDLGRVHDLEKELSPLEPRCEDVAKHAPELTQQAYALLHRVQGFDHRHLCWRFQPVHRDMYHDQILMDRGRLAILDLDDAAMSEPAVDVANFIAHLMLSGIQREADPQAFQHVIDAFLNQYLALDDELDLQLVDFLTATTLLRLAGIHVPRENGSEVARLVIESANRLLDSIAAERGSRSDTPGRYA